MWDNIKKVNTARIEGNMKSNHDPILPSILAVFYISYNSSMFFL